MTIFLSSIILSCLGMSWIELPAVDSLRADSDSVRITHCVTVSDNTGTCSHKERNYTILYDKSLYTSLWVAYPLCSAHLGTGRQDPWGFDPDVSPKFQTSVRSGYGVSFSTENYVRNFYARGHQIPNADRNGIPAMMDQTYYSTNMTPQIQNGFNGSVWARLESAIRDEARKTDTLYVVSGAVFRKQGGDETIIHITNANDGKSLPVPNYYYKAVLKVIRGSDGTPCEACAIGFWLPHKDLKNHKFTEYAVPVDSLEVWTGNDFFTILPDSPVESVAEMNSSWQAFQDF